VREKRRQNEWIRVRRENDELKAKKTYVNDRHRSMMVTQGKALAVKTNQPFSQRLMVNQ
jgi:hypothetical protein